MVAIPFQLRHREAAAGGASGGGCSRRKQVPVPLLHGDAVVRARPIRPLPLRKLTPRSTGRGKAENKVRKIEIDVIFLRSPLA